MNAIILAVCLISGVQQPAQERDELRERGNAMITELGPYPLDIFTASTKEAFLADVRFAGVVKLDGEVFLKFAEEREGDPCFWFVPKADIKAYRQHIGRRLSAKK